MQTRTVVFTALIAALISVGAYVAVPIGPVPVTLQTLFLLTGALLAGPRIAVSASVLYLLTGAIGLPVFSGGTGGIAHFFSPTGGYLLGMVPAAWIAGVFGRSAAGHRLTSRTKWLKRTIPGAVLGSAAIYLAGVPWLAFTLSLSWERALTIGVLPFIIGDGMKIAAALMLAWMFSEQALSMLCASTEEP